MLATNTIVLATEKDSLVHDNGWRLGSHLEALIAGNLEQTRTEVAVRGGGGMVERESEAAVNIHRPSDQINEGLLEQSWRSVSRNAGCRQLSIATIECETAGTAGMQPDQRGKGNSKWDARDHRHCQRGGFGGSSAWQDQHLQGAGAPKSANLS